MWENAQKTDKCTLKRPCNICKEIHLTILHDLHIPKSATVMFPSSPPELLCVDQPYQLSKHLGLVTQPETISLHTVRHDIVQLGGASVSFESSP